MGAVDWTQYASEELSLDEVRGLKEGNDFWGWVDGMYIAGGDDRIAVRFLNGRNYESVTRELWRRLCAGAKLVADIGTHSGVFTLDAFRAGAKRVFSAEPHPYNFSRLAMNVRYNGFPPNDLFYGAIGDENRTDHLMVKQFLYYCHAAGQVGLHSKNGLEFPVQVARMDTALARDSWPDLKVVKIDAENLTPAVLIGMGEMLDHRPDLIIECTVPGMEKLLDPYGYKYWMIRETGTIEEVENLTPHNPGNNYNGTDENCRNRFASVKGLP